MNLAIEQTFCARFNPKFTRKQWRLARRWWNTAALTHSHRQELTSRLTNREQTTAVWDALLLIVSANTRLPAGIGRARRRTPALSSSAVLHVGVDSVIKIKILCWMLMMAGRLVQQALVKSVRARVCECAREDEMSCMCARGWATIPQPQRVRAFTQAAHTSFTCRCSV